MNTKNKSTGAISSSLILNVLLIAAIAATVYVMIGRTGQNTEGSTNPAPAPAPTAAVSSTAQPAQQNPVTVAPVEDIDELKKQLEHENERLASLRKQEEMVEALRKEAEMREALRVETERLSDPAINPAEPVSESEPSAESSTTVRAAPEPAPATTQ